MKLLKVLLLLITIGCLIYLIYLVIHCKRTDRILKTFFDKTSNIIFGAKGTGKDLLNQHIINIKKEPYLANIPYGHEYYLEPIKNLNIDPNTFHNFIDEKVYTIEKNDIYEGLDYYVSEAGIQLPCQFNNELTKKYKSLPIYYALSRHLYNQNININSQYIDRAWNLLREQADGFVRTIKTIPLFKGIICKIRLYDKYESAKANLLPMKKKLFNKIHNAIVDQYNATNGYIENRMYYIKKKNIYYDTRHFHKVVFGETIEEWNERTKNINKKELKKIIKKINSIST